MIVLASWSTASFPYFGGFQLLLRDGLTSRKSTRQWNALAGQWDQPILDVVGMTPHIMWHMSLLRAPDRMASEERTALHVMYDNERFGQKNSKGFYQYSIDRKGKPKSTDDGVPALLIRSCQMATDISEENRRQMMIPMIIETAAASKTALWTLSTKPIWASP